ncbi:MAG: dUTP diphosphatase, partial [Lachnospiraceae bacterium]|nr:dUTP diphosphatase [Lachnospiraceae bacterium]
GVGFKNGIGAGKNGRGLGGTLRGEIMVALHNHSTSPVSIEPKERIAQLVITPYLTAHFEETSELSDTLRGEGGFGSTGRR